MKHTIIIITLLVAGLTAGAQASRHQLREGNREYKKQHYDQAEVAYRRALERDSTDARGQYNLGNTLYRQKKYDEANRHYEQAYTSPKMSAKQRAHTLHNRGNSLLKSGMESQDQQKLQQALASYQEALKLDPKNEDTRYNLALARHLLQQAQQNQQNQGGGNDKDQNQDKQNQQQNQQQNQGDQQQKDKQQNQQGDQQQQNQQDQSQGQQQKSKEQQAREDMKKRDAERMLEAMKNNERQTLRERERKDIPVGGKKTDKDW